MKKYLITVILLISMSASAQFNSLKIRFYPSFIASSSLMIDKSGDGYTMQLKGNNWEEKSRVPDTTAVKLEKFLNNYEFLHKGSTDTIAKKVIQQNGDTLIQYSILEGTDGIDVYGELKNKSTTRTFKFWSPDIETLNHKLIELLFEMMYAGFIKPDSLEYLEKLKLYFEF